MSNDTAGRPGGAEEIVTTIERAIRAGELGPGARLPTVRDAAVTWGLAPGTVAAAYRELSRRGTVIGRGRAGTFVATRPPVGPAGYGALPGGVVDLRSGNPDPALLPVLPRPQGDVVLYGSPQVDPALARAGRGWFEARSVDATHFGVVGGAMDGVERVLQAHLRPGDAIAVEDPGYPNIVDIARSLGLATEPVTTDGAGLVPEALAAVLARVRAVVLTPRALNPTGAAVTPGRRERLRDVLSAHPDVLVVEDDHNGDVSGVPLCSVAGDGARRWAVVHSVAKSFGPDWRLALLAGDADTVERVQLRQRLGVGWVSHLLQRPVGAALEDPRIAAQLRHAASVYSARRTALLGALADRGVLAGGGSGFNIWLPVADETALVAGLLGRGWGVHGGARFRHRSDPAVRISTSRLDPAEAPRLAQDIAMLLADHPISA